MKMSTVNVNCEVTQLRYIEKRHRENFNNPYSFVKVGQQIEQQNHKNSLWYHVTKVELNIIAIQRQREYV